MNRRAYLAAAATLTVGGCMGGSDDPANDSNDSNGDGLSDGNGIGSGDEQNETETETPESDDPETIETFDDFQNLDDWEVLHGSAAVDDSRSFTGDRSILMEAGAGSDGAGIARTLSTPLDASDVVPGLAVVADSEVTPMIQLVDEDRNKFRYQARVQPGSTFHRYNFGLSEVKGDPDIGAITEIYITVWVGDQETSLWVDDLHFAPKSDGGNVMVHFDGGYETAYTEALPILEDRDIPATVFAPTDRIREESTHEGSRLTESQLDELAAAGWTIGGYGTHGLDFTEMRSAEREASIEGAASWLDDRGYADDGLYFAYPNGGYDDALRGSVADAFDVGFATGYGPTGTVVDASAVPRVSDPDAAEARRVLDWTAEHGGTATLVFYRLGDGAGDFEAAMDHLHDLESAGEVTAVLPGDLDPVDG